MSAASREIVARATAALRRRQPQDALALLAQPAAAGMAAEHARGLALQMLGRLDEAEAAWRRICVAHPEEQQPAADLATLLTARARAAEAVTASDPAAAVARPAPALLYARANAFKQLRRFAECMRAHERLVALGHRDAFSLHNLAAAAGDAGWPERAAKVARQAIAAGSDAAETWLVLARALQGCDRLDAAAEAFRTALARRPGYGIAMRDLAQLAWMRSGRLDEAFATLEGQQGPAVALVRAELHAGAGDPEGAYRSLAASAPSGDTETEVRLSTYALGHAPEAALDHARRALALSPQSGGAARALATALLALGQPGDALPLLEAALACAPLDQSLLALRWTAMRLMGDERAADLYDYRRMVFTATLDCPNGWAGLDRYLADLATELTVVHPFRSHPLAQTLRNGTQNSRDLRTAGTPALAAFPQAIDGPIRRYLAQLGTGGDPLRRRNRGNYRIDSMWSVLLRREGFHLDHVHARGWISSACYVDVDGVGDDDHAGWIRFGLPGIPTRPALPPEHVVRPRAGMLVLFPSYMWHGTVASRAERRRTIAFDLVPRDEG